MNESLAELLAPVQMWLVTGVVVFLRVGGCFLVLPALGEAMIPVRARLGAALALSFVITPTRLADMQFQAAAINLEFSMFFSETLSGLVIGLSLRLIVHAIQIAGSIAAQATSLSQIMGGASPDPQPAMGAIWMLSGLTLAVMSGLHLHLVATFVRSYTLLPVGVFPTPHDLGRWVVDWVTASFALAVSLAAPFLIASLLYNMALGVINKAMPQLMVAFVGAPAITWGGLLLFMIATPLIVPVWFDTFLSVLYDPFGAP